MKETIPAMMFARAARDDGRPAHFWKEGDQWHGETWSQGLVEIAGVAALLEAYGVGKGVPVAILANTRKEWAGADMATLCLGGITVGIYPTLTAEQVRYQLHHSEARVLILEDAEQAEKIEAIRGDLPHLKHVLSIDPTEGMPSWKSLVKAGDVAWLRSRADEVDADDIATYIYTSGTTGDPKGAILTHGNFHRVAHSCKDIPRMEAGDRALIFLPLAHALQRFGSYRGLLNDVVGYYAEGIHKVPEGLMISRPNVLASVPRMLEKIHAKAEAGAAEKGGIAHKIYKWSLGVGLQKFECEARKEPVPWWIRVQMRLAGRIHQKIRDRLGGEIRVMVSGGAALNPTVHRWFGAIGVTILEGYGLTETSAAVTANREGDFRIGTVGKPVPGVDVKIAEDGEILVKSPGIFAGYYKNPEATEAAFVDGWFRTGDIGAFDEDGFLKITDRKKEIIITAGGKNIPPVNIEKRIERSPYVAQAVAVGEGRPYLVALLVPDEEALEAFARQVGLPQEPLEKRIHRPETAALFQAAVENANAELARFESVKKFATLPVLFSVESGELTPTLKLKRRVVSEKFGHVIEQLYG